jgi:hypothetical protein
MPEQHRRQREPQLRQVDRLQRQAQAVSLVVRQAALQQAAHHLRVAVARWLPPELQGRLVQKRPAAVSVPVESQMREPDMLELRVAELRLGQAQVVALLVLREPRTQPRAVTLGPLEWRELLAVDRWIL